MSDEISEADWERAASKKNSVSLERDFGDERLYVPTASPIHVTHEEALAAQAELDADEVTDAELGAAWAEWCLILKSFDFDYGGKGIKEFALSDMRRILQAAEKARRA